jgi:hypothetical protein
LKRNLAKTIAQTTMPQNATIPKTMFPNINSILVLGTRLEIGKQQHIQHR